MRLSLFGGSDAGSARDVRDERIRMTGGALGALLLFFGALLPGAIPLRVVSMTLGIALLLTEILLLRSTRRHKTMLSALAIIVPIGILGLVEALTGVIGDRMFAVNGEHLLVLFPILGVFGYVVARNGSARVYATGFLGIAALAAVLAIAEWVLHLSLFGRPEFVTSQREGATRALLGAEHVLVLGALFAVSVAFAPIVRRWILRVPFTVLLLAGCWATGSRAAAVASLLVAVIQEVPSLMSLLQRLRWVLLTVIGISVVGIAYLSTMVWTTHIPGRTGLEYSENYRYASYAMLGEILQHRPLGYLLGGAPRGVWMMSSDLRGPVDLARSADSEIIFAVFTAGWAGIVTFLVIAVLAVLAIRRSPTIGLSLLLMTGLGVIMSLHGWDAMSLLWYVLIGAAAAMVRKEPPQLISAEGAEAHRVDPL